MEIIGDVGLGVAPVRERTPERLQVGDGVEVGGGLLAAVGAVEVGVDGAVGALPANWQMWS